MSSRAYIGTNHPEQPGTVQLRCLHSDGYPDWAVRAVQRIWATTAHRDTRRLITLLLEHDWDYLDPATTATDAPPFAGEQPVPGVGMTLAVTDVSTNEVLPPDPVTVVALTDTGDLGASWIYLLDPDTDTIAVHLSGGTPAGVQPLAS